MRALKLIWLVLYVYYRFCDSRKDRELQWTCQPFRDPFQKQISKPFKTQFTTKNA